MRFYSVEIQGLVAAPSATFTSVVNGQVDPGALDIEIGIQAFNMAAPVGMGHVRIWGVSLPTVLQASQFQNASITVSAGMSPGLPLATAAYQAGQQGVIAKGTVFQAYGNWVDTEQYLDLIIATDGGATQSQPANLTFAWPKGTMLGAGIHQTLQTAYPGWDVASHVSPNLLLPENVSGAYQTLGQFAAFVNDYSRSLMSGDTTYNGIDITPIAGTSFRLYDGTQQMPSGPKQLAFQDLIGQPTWFGKDQISFDTMMRADIAVGDQIMFPGVLTTSSEAELGSQPADKIALTGAFAIQMARHVGRFRNPSGGAWVTTFQAYSNPTGTAAAQLPDVQGGSQ